MLSERDFTRCANLMMGKYGERAARRADLLADQFVAGNNAGSAAIWREVADTIRRLQMSEIVTESDHPEELAPPDVVVLGIGHAGAVEPASVQQACRGALDRPGMGDHAVHTRLAHRGVD